MPHLLGVRYLVLHVPAVAPQLEGLGGLGGALGIGVEVALGGDLFADLRQVIIGLHKVCLILGHHTVCSYAVYHMLSLLSLSKIYLIYLHQRPAIPVPLISLSSISSRVVSRRQEAE